MIYCNAVTSNELLKALDLGMGAFVTIAFFLVRTLGQLGRSYRKCPARVDRPPSHWEKRFAISTNKLEI